MIKQFTTTFSEDELTALIQNAVLNSNPNRPESSQAEVITRDELCKRLGVTEPTVIKMERKGKIPSLRIGTACRYNWNAVLKALENK